jgi:ribosomal protein L40E
MEGIFTILIFMGVIAITALIFGVWIIATIVRLFFRGIFGLFNPPNQPQISAAHGVICRNDRCRAANPGTAQFCRRCGQKLPQPQRVNVRRAAMW